MLQRMTIPGGQRAAAWAALCAVALLWSAAPAGGSPRLRQIEAQAQRGEHAAAIEAVQSQLDELRHDELAGGLSLLGRSQLALARQRRDRALLTQAGLNLMRVAVWFPNSDQAPEALHQAGEINAQLGNRRAARAAWERVISQYEASPSAQRARRALEQLDGR